MAARPALVTQLEIKRAVAGAQAAGLRIGRIEVDQTTGKVVIWPEGASESGPNPCDRLLKK